MPAASPIPVLGTAKLARLKAEIGDRVLVFDRPPLEGLALPYVKLVAERDDPRRASKNVRVHVCESTCEIVSDPFDEGALTGREVTNLVIAAMATPLDLTADGYQIDEQYAASVDRAEFEGDGGERIDLTTIIFRYEVQ